MTDQHWLLAMPEHEFNCRIVYQTPFGHRRTAHYKTRARFADAALDVAERLLHRDKRRKVARVTYGEAIQQ
jgi:hypothetical protein